jgi:CBS domain-containing protein
VSTSASTKDSVSLISLLKHVVVGGGNHPGGTLEDAVMQFREDEYPLLTGLLMSVDGGTVFVPAAGIADISANGVRLIQSPSIRTPFNRQEGQLLLKAEVLGRWLIDLRKGVLVKAHDVRLATTTGGWRAVGVDVHKHSWLHFGPHEARPARDWRDFLVLIGDHGRSKYPFFSNRIRRLKPAQIADIIETAAAPERSVLMDMVHVDPKLEASVFEELDDDQQTRLLKSRSNEEIADVLSRMRADDAADAVMTLPQDRRRSVLDLLSAPQGKKVLTLLGYNQATAGGLMGTDYLALTEEHSIEDALEQLRLAVNEQPEALVTIHSLRPDGTLAGTLSLVRALQLDSATLLRDAADAQIVVASPDDDIVVVTTRMADYNLLSLPVVDVSGRLLGIVTVDDALEAAIPQAWSRREAGRSSLAKRLES